MSEEESESEIVTISENKTPFQSNTLKNAPHIIFKNNDTPRKSSWEDVELTSIPTQSDEIESTETMFNNNEETKTLTSITSHYRRREHTPNPVPLPRKKSLPREHDSSTSTLNEMPSPAITIRPRPEPRAVRTPQSQASRKLPRDLPIHDDTRHSVKDISSLGSRRQSIGDWSVGSGRSMTSQSDNRSYRERLRDRIQNVKERASTSIVATHSRLRHSNRLRSPAIAKFHDLLQKEEADIELALERHKEMRVKWKWAATASLEATEALDFFTKVWEDDEESPNPNPLLQESPKHDATASPPSADIESAEDDQVKLLTKDYMGLPDEWQVVEPYVPPSLDENELRIDNENKLYFYPSDSFLTLEEKLGPDFVARYVEDEGLFVSDKPDISSKFYNKMQHRLLAVDGRKWFGDDGEMMVLSDPLLTLVYRLNFCDGNQSEESQVQYKHAVLMPLSQKTISNEEVPEDVTYLLELEVGTVEWQHHPLFSQEHVAVQKVKERFKDYQSRVNGGIGRRLAGKLQALRVARDNMKNVLQGGDTAQYLDRLNRYKYEIRETRELRLQEGEKDRKCIVSVLNAWKDLRNLRRDQGYNITSIKLNIIQLDAESDMFGLAAEWDYEFKNQCEEVMEELELEYKKQIEKLNEQIGVTEEQGEGDKEEKTIPKEITTQEIEAKVLLKMKERIRHVDEPVIALELVDETHINEEEITELKELQRQAAQKRCIVCIRINYNQQEVCCSRSHMLSSHFTTTINQRFAIRILQWPQTLSVQIVQEGGLSSRKLYNEVFIPLPTRTMTIENSSLEELQFSNMEKCGPYKHSGVGSGIVVDNEILNMSGSVNYKVGWGMKDGQILAPPEKYLPASKQRKEFKLLSDITKLRDWAEHTQLDPNDPSNAAAFDYLKNANNSAKSKLNPLQGEFDFCTEEELYEDSRLKLLTLRDKDVPEFRNLRNIPLRRREIPDDIFKVYEKRVRSPARSMPDIGETSLEWHREWSKHELNLLRDNIISHCRQAQHQRALRDMVVEDQVPDIGTLGLTFMKWLQPKRPLRPTRKERKKVPVKSLVGQEVEVIVNVVRAFEVPVRVDVDPIVEGGLNLVPVRPFVEVSFQRQRRCTTTAEGANPTWNQDLHIPLQTLKDSLSSGGIHNIQDKLYCHLYDEVIVDLLEDDRQRETNIHQRLQRHWLGSLTIPFSSLCNNPRIEGTFQLYSPSVLLGYERESQHRQYGGVLSDTSHLRDSTFLTLFITVHPPLHPPEPFKEKLACSEESYLEQHLEVWKTQVIAQVPHRNFKTLVVDTSAHSVCITRFFRPLDLPVIEEGVDTTPEMAARFVSRIPMVAGSMLFPGLFDIWLTADQVLRLLSGDSEDHAILLCCYLLKLGLKAWLLLGSGVPHGATAYVLTKSPTSDYILWDPPTGNKFSILDSFCPLHKVFCLVNQDNIWANIQREEVISRTRFDVTKRSDWWPAFGRTVSAPLGSVQPEQMDYTRKSTLQTDASLLQDKLEKLLRDSITRWRPTSRTVWNRYVTVTLRKLLPGLESATWANNPNSVKIEHINQLSHCLGSHKMCGFPLNFVYTSIQDIVEAVKATGIHSNENADVEFALAVYVHTFPCNVISIWVYVASLSLRR